MKALGWLWLISGVSSAVLSIGYLWRRRERPLSTDWWLELQRREGRLGRDQVAIQFPINKGVNEAARWNADQLRKRA